MSTPRVLVSSLALAAAAGPAGAGLSGDFNGDGFADIAMAAPDRAVGGTFGAGSVWVKLGNGGATTVLTPASLGVTGAVRLGRALAVGDFDRDGFADLALSLPFHGKIVGSTIRIGAVAILRGSASGLRTSDIRWLFCPEETPAGAVDLNFGAALAAGDFNSDGADDLAVGCPIATVGTGAGMKTQAGKVFTYTSREIYDEVLPLYQQQAWSHANIPGLAPDADAHLGMALASGDFNGDGWFDLAMGAPGYGFSSSTQGAGAVTVIHGSPAGPSTYQSKHLHEHGTLAGTARADESLGAALAAGKFAMGRYWGLAIGAPGESNDIVLRTGAVYIVNGSDTTLRSDGKTEAWHQDTPGIEGECEGQEQWGASLAVGRLNSDVYDDLVVGAPFDMVKIGDIHEITGTVQAFYTSPTGSGLKIAGNQTWHQNSSGIPDAAERDDFFGASVVATRRSFDNDAFGDLFVGVPGEDVGSVFNAGAVCLIRGGASGLTGSGSVLFTLDSAGFAGAPAAGDSFGGFLGGR